LLPSALRPQSSVFSSPTSLKHCRTAKVERRALENKVYYLTLTQHSTLDFRPRRPPSVLCLFFSFDSRPSTLVIRLSTSISCSPRPLPP
jgi:hypothetical protein